MTQVLEPIPKETPAETDLGPSIQSALASSDEPQTLSKIRSHLPVRLREVGLEALAAALNLLVAKQVVWQFPKYRSAQERYWDRPMPVHVVALIRGALEEGPLGSAELRRKLPAYAQPLAEDALKEQLSLGQLHRHPKVGRSAERIGVAPPDPRSYLRSDLIEVFGRLEKLGFKQDQLRGATLELLHDEEWASPPAAPPAEAPPSAAAEGTTPAAGHETAHATHLPAAPAEAPAMHASGHESLEPRSTHETGGVHA